MDIFYPIQIFADWITFDLLNLYTNSHFAHALNFFIYDSIKIFILLIIIIHIMTMVNYYLPVEKIRNFLTSRNRYGFDHLMASFFGTITPFCSCSSIPLFIGFLKSGIPLGVTLSFLITSPLVNEVAIALFLGIFGIKITIIYVLSGVILGVLGGFVLGKMGLEKYIADFVKESIKNGNKNNTIQTNIKVPNVWKKIYTDSRSLIKKIMPYVLIGIAIGGLIHGYVPTDFFETYLSKESWYGVPAAVILGIPMYTNASGVIPIVQSLVAKGVPLGTGLAFMMAVVGLSLPEFLILKKVMKIQLLLLFFSIIGLFIIILGYFFNAVL